VSETVLTTTIQRIIFRKPESGWCIAKTDAGTVKGEIAFDPKEGDRVKLEGQWKNSKFNGEKEFVFKTCLLDVPDDAQALLHYAVELTKGMGPAMEAAIWEAYGPNWQQHPELDGISKVRAETRACWQDTLQRLGEQREQTQAIAFLMSHGATLNMSAAAWEKWGFNTVSVVERNPYRLADLPHYGFLDVEQGIRQKFDIDDKDQRRVDAAIIYVMEQSAEKSGTMTARSHIEGELMRFVPDAIGMMDDCLERLHSEGHIARLDVDWMALGVDAKNEKEIWERFI